MAYIVVAYIVMAYIVMAYVVMAKKVTAYIVMACTVMAYILMTAAARSSAYRLSPFWPKMHHEDRHSRLQYDLTCDVTTRAIWSPVQYGHPCNMARLAIWPKSAAGASTLPPACTYVSRHAAECKLPYGPHSVEGSRRDDSNFGHNYIGHNYIAHNYIGHNYICHDSAERSR